MDYTNIYNERLARIRDCINLKEPDRVPVVAKTDFFTASYAGISSYDLLYDKKKMIAAYEKIAKDLNFDGLAQPPFLHMGPMMDAMDQTLLKIPGRDLPPDFTYQFVERELMKPEEYDTFIRNPIGYWIDTLPRISQTPLSLLSGTKTLIGMMGWYIGWMQTVKRVEALGVPYITQNTMFDPWDMLSLTWPGMLGLSRSLTGLTTDMYRRPEKVIAAHDVLTDFYLALAKIEVALTGNKALYIICLRGGTTFLSPKQFERLYWPGMKKLLMGLIKEDITPFLLLEADWGLNLPFFRELPKAKCIIDLDMTDMAKAEEIIGDRQCLMDGIPVSLLSVGTPKQVEEYCKNIIDICGEGGGYILAPGCLTPPDAKVENIRAMINVAKTYGRYR